MLLGFFTKRVLLVTIGGYSYDARFIIAERDAQSAEREYVTLCSMRHAHALYLLTSTAA